MNDRIYHITSQTLTMDLDTIDNYIIVYIQVGRVGNDHDGTYILDLVSRKTLNRIRKYVNPVLPKNTTQVDMCKQYVKEYYPDKIVDENEIVVDCATVGYSSYTKLSKLKGKFVIPFDVQYEDDINLEMWSEHEQNTSLMVHLGIEKTEKYGTPKLSFYDISLNFWDWIRNVNHPD